MSTENLKIKEIIERMCLAAEVKNAAKLSEYLGYKSTGTVSQWRNKKEVPSKAIDVIATKTGASRDWLKTGEGEMRPPPYQEQNGTGHALAGEPGPVSAEEFRLLNAYRALCPDQRKMFLRIIVEEAKESRQNEGGGSDLVEANSA